MSAIGDKFKECRLEKGLSVREVAEKAGVSDTEVFRIETGRRVNPSAKILVSIGKALIGNIKVIAGRQIPFHIKITGMNFRVCHNAIPKPIKNS